MKENLILLVDDSGITRELISNFLIGHGMKVHEAADGFSAIEMAKKNNYCLLIFDIIMPEMNGIELTKIIRELPGYETTPIIGITGDANARKENEFLFAGGDEFFIKSISPSVLFEKVNEMLIKTQLYDRSVADTYTQNNEESRLKMLNLYSKEVANSIHLLSNSDDFNILKDCAHKLSSSSLYCGYILTRNVALQLEENILNNAERNIIIDLKNKLLLMLELTEEHVLTTINSNK